jgi:hypothetical protein
MRQEQFAESVHYRAHDRKRILPHQEVKNVVHYNELVGSRTGRSLVVRREESPNSAEQCAG